MAIENSKDKQIEDLTAYSELKAIKVDFRDLNNKNLIIKNAFKDAFLKLDSFDENGWYFICSLDVINNKINIIGIVNMLLGADNYLHLNWLETNQVFRNKNYSTEILTYLKKYTNWERLKGIIANCEKLEQHPVFKKNGFKPIGANVLNLSWESERS